MKLTLKVPDSGAGFAAPAAEYSPLSALLEAFILRCKAKSLSPGTFRWYKDKLTPFLAFLEDRKIKDIGTLTPIDIRAYLDSLRACNKLQNAKMEVIS